MVTLEEFKKKTICHFFIAITVFTSALFCSIVQLLLLILVKPWNAALFRKLMSYPCYSFYSQLTCVTEWYGGSKLRLYMDAEDERKFAGKEHGLMIMNHTYEIDWICGWMVLDKLLLLGTSKAIAKKALRYVPIVGWVWWMAEFVFLNRDIDKDKAILKKKLKTIYTYPYPTWVLLAAEGTRFTPAKHEASAKFAQENGLTVLKHHLTPRTKGFTTSLPSLRGICPAIYDINLVFKRDAKVQPTIDSILNGETLEPIMFVRRIPLDQVPTDEKAAADWLQQLYIEKDRIVDSFHETGSFFKTSGIKEVPSRVCAPRLSTLLNFSLTAIGSISFIFYYLISSLLAANWFGLSIALLILGFFYWLLGKASNMSKISKSSSYGAAEGKTKRN